MCHPPPRRGPQEAGSWARRRLWRRCRGGGRQRGTEARGRQRPHHLHTTCSFPRSERGCRERRGEETRGGGSLLRRAPAAGAERGLGTGCGCSPGTPARGQLALATEEPLFSPTRSSQRGESSSQRVAAAEGTSVLPREMRAVPAGLSPRKERQESRLLSKTYSHLRADTMLVTNVHS